MKHTTMTLLWAILLGVPAYAQPDIDWQRNVGGSANDWPWTLSHTNDGGFIVAGQTSSNDGDVVGQHGFLDAWLVKFDSNGSMEWQNCLGGTSVDYIQHVYQTADNGYIATGFTKSTDGDVSELNGTSDIWVLRFDENGTLLWEKTYGGSAGEAGRRVHELPNGDLLLLAETSSMDGPMSDNHSASRDLWLARTTYNGALLWTKCLGGTGDDTPRDMFVHPNGEIFIVGIVRSSDGDVSGYHEGGPSRPADSWLVKVDQEGTIIWQLCLGGSDIDTGQGVTVAANGKVFVASTSISSDGDRTDPIGDWDYWISRVSEMGILELERSFGGTNGDQLSSIVMDASGSLYVTGSSPSMDGDISDPHGSSDAWTVKLDQEFELIWERSFGGSSPETGWALAITPEGVLALTATSSSSDGDLTGNNGGSDFWVVKLRPEPVGINETVLRHFTLYPNPATSELRIGLNGIAAKRLEVIDITGRVVMNKSITRGAPSVDLSIAQLAQGTYSLRVLGDASYTQRFVKH